MALSLLAGLSHGCTEAILLAHGFTIEMLTVLVRGGLATATPKIVHGGGRPSRAAVASVTGPKNRAASSSSFNSFNACPGLFQVAFEIGGRLRSPQLRGYDAAIGRAHRGGGQFLG
jgi:hypothetical protein